MDDELFRARAYVAHVMMMKRRFHLLEEAGYFVEGKARRGAEAKGIWDFVDAQMRALPPFTDAQIDAELWKGDAR